MTVFVTADMPAYECADPPIECLWRSTVRDEDLVYLITGASADLTLSQVEGLPGRKRLITTPHELDGRFLLSPLPLHPSQMAPGQVNLHGRPLRPLPADPRHLCVSLDLNGFRPVPLDTIRMLARRGQSTLRAVAAASNGPQAWCEAAE